MTAFAHTLLVIAGYIVAALVGFGYLDIAFLLAGAGGDLKYIAAPKVRRAGIHHFPTYWEELSEAAQAKGKKRLPLAICLYILSWVAYLVIAYFVAFYLLPAIVDFFTNIH